MPRTIKGYPNYVINEDGEVWNIKRNTQLTPMISTKDYLYVTLSHNNVKRRFVLCRLVAEHFVPGKTKQKNKVIYINHNKSDCSVENLKWGTHQEACQLGFTGCHDGMRGEVNPNSKLTQKDVDSIRKEHRLRKKSHRELAKVYDVSPTTIYNILTERTW